MLEGDIIPLIAEYESDEPIPTARLTSRVVIQNYKKVKNFFFGPVRILSARPECSAQLERWHPHPRSPRGYAWISRPDPKSSRRC